MIILAPVRLALFPFWKRTNKKRGNFLPAAMVFANAPYSAHPLIVEAGSFVNIS
ncbi:hypothetical protein ACQY1Z_20030 [Microcystis aeruginosa FBCC-A68]|uniref:hypothetical protein n=1 Tax=Microcystis aeruginosa TaxID=1126 RepID=UPI003D292BF6